MKKKNEMRKSFKYLIIKFIEFLYDYKVIIITILFLLYIFYWEHNNVFHLIDLKKEINALEKKKQSEEEKFNADKAYFYLLKNDEPTFERYIRERFYFHRPEEEVYVIKTK